jgi:hypothetical protein
MKTNNETHQRHHLFRQLFLVSVLGAMVALSGCASRVFIQSNRFLAPEASGHFLGGDVKTGAAGVTHVQVADNMTSASPNTTPVLAKNSTVLFGGQLGLLSALDLYLTSGVGMAEVVGFKLQMIGAPMNAAKAGNFSLAIAGGGAFGSTKQTSEFGDVKGATNSEFGGWEAMVLAGYRPFDSLLVYASPFASKTNATVKVERTASGVTSTTAEPNGFGEMKGVTLGARLGTNFFVSVEGTLTETTWTRSSPTELKTDKFSDQALGLVAGVSW